jgi:hypothetical protein
VFHLHVHAAPDIGPRLGDDTETAPAPEALSLLIDVLERKGFDRGALLPIAGESPEWRVTAA